MSGQLALALTFQDLCLDHVVVVNLNVVVVVQDAIPHSERLHCLLQFQTHKVLGCSHQFTYSVVVGCQGPDPSNDLLICQYFYPQFVVGIWSRDFENLMSLSV